MSKKTCMPAMAMMAAPMLGWGMMKMMRSAMAGQGTDWSCEQTPGASAWEPEGEGETGNARDASAAPEAPQQDLVDIAAGVGLPTGDAERALRSTVIARAVRDEERAWVARGIHGVPAVIVEQRYRVAGAQGVAGYARLLAGIRDGALA